MLPPKILFFFFSLSWFHALLAILLKQKSLFSLLVSYSHFINFLLSPKRRNPWANVPLQLHSSCSVFSSPLPTGEDPWAKAIKYFTTWSIYNTSIPIPWWTRNTLLFWQWIGFSYTPRNNISFHTKKTQILNQFIIGICDIFSTHGTTLIKNRRNESCKCMLSSRIEWGS